MADLVRGRYNVTNPLWSYVGQAVNGTQSDIAVRSNAAVLGLAGLTDSAAALTTQVCTAVPVPVEYGDVISKVTVVVGATAAGTPTNAFAALYSGIATTPALLAQATDISSAAIAASAVFTFTLASSVLVTPANAPFGYIYASIMSKATVVPSLATVSVAAAVAYKWGLTGATAPLGMGAITHGSALTTTAPATITSPTAQAATPIVFLS
jgi:hypothetical protein